MFILLQVFLAFAVLAIAVGVRYLYQWQKARHKRYYEEYERDKQASTNLIVPKHEMDQEAIARYCPCPGCHNIIKFTNMYGDHIGCLHNQLGFYGEFDSCDEWQRIAYHRMLTQRFAYYQMLNSVAL
jgi:hypothetical protein